MDEPADIGDVVRRGVIAEVQGRRARVRLDDGHETGWLPAPFVRCGAVKFWVRISVGEQVRLICPEGDVLQGAIGFSESYDDQPAPEAEGDLVVEFEDGAVIRYSLTDGLVAELPGKARVVAPGGLDLVADVAITGALTVSETIDAQGLIRSTDDVKAGDVSLASHKHGQVSAGQAKTGGPE